MTSSQQWQTQYGARVYGLGAIRFGSRANTNACKYSLYPCIYPDNDTPPTSFEHASDTVGAQTLCLPNEE